MDGRSAAEPQETAMIADMHRLERAARLSMGEFEAAPPAAPPSRQPLLGPKAAMVLAALGAVAVAAFLLG